MYTDARISAVCTVMLDSIHAPDVPIQSIRSRMASSQSVTPQYHPSRWMRPALAAAVLVSVVAIATPIVSPGLVQSLEQRLADLLGGWQPPPATPRSVLNALKAQRTSLAAAQTRVLFTIVSASGLPSDVTSRTLWIGPTGVYEKTIRQWSVGAPALTFVYHRTSGRTFSIVADSYGPRTGPPGKYMYEDTGLVRNCLPVLIRHRKFSWRNGNQVMTTIAGYGISNAEIESIVSAMNGTLIPPALSPHAVNAGTIVRIYGLVSP
jgi:hypothetical protein